MTGWSKEKTEQANVGRFGDVPIGMLSLLLSVGWVLISPISPRENELQNAADASARRGFRLDFSPDGSGMLSDESCDTA